MIDKIGAFPSYALSIYGVQVDPNHASSIYGSQANIGNRINHLGGIIRYLGILLKSFSTLNNKLSFLDGFDFVTTFKSSNKNYVSFAQLHRKLVSHYHEKTIDRYLEQCPKFQNGERFHQIEETIEKVKSEFKTLLDLFDHTKICHDSERCADSIALFRQEIEKDPEELDRKKWDDCTDQLSTIIENKREFIHNEKKESLEEVNNLDPYYDLCPGRPFYESLGPDVEEVLDEQYLVGCLMRGRREFEWMHKSLEDIYSTYRSEWGLPKEDFRELAFLKRIIRPERLKAAMEILYDHQETDYDKHIALTSRLKQVLGEAFPEAVRVQKAITIYKKWQSELNEYIHRYSGNSNEQSRVTKAYTITQKLSYGKSRFMNGMFNGGQYADAVLKALETYTSYVKNKSPQEKLAFLRRVRKRCLERSSVLEEALYQIGGIQSVFDDKYIASLFGLGITEQPAYKTARLANQMISESVYGFGKDDIPEELQHAGGHLTGMIVFSAEHMMSSWLGGSYLLISSLNRCLFAHLGAFIRCAEAVDALSQRVLEPVLSKATAYAPESMRPGVEWLKEGVRWDEEGLMHKEAHLKRLSELLIAIAFTGGESVLPTAVAFSLARLFSEGAGRVSTWTLHTSRLCNRSTAEKIGYFIQFLSYSLTYKYGFKLGTQMFPEREGMSVSDALDVLGLPPSVTDREVIRDAHQYLSFSYHPDKNLDADAAHLEVLTDKFQQVQAAYKVLKKKKL